MTAHERPLEQGRGAWGMLMFIATEASLFVMLLFAYFYLGSSHPAWPPELPELGMASLMTVILLSSSVTLHLASNAIRRADHAGLVRGVVFTIVLGAMFLAAQAFEYRERWETLTPQTNPYGSIFYTITSVHGAHVLLGLLMLSFIGLRAGRGAFDSEHHLAVRNVSWYWHFVDLVWILIFTTLYLAPRVGS
jgi:heme/copper-type cytochrome/quinol oxidase subunit 3